MLRRGIAVAVLAVSVWAYAPAANGAAEKPWFPSSGAYLGASVGKQQDLSPPACRSTLPREGRTLFEGPLCVGRTVFLDHEFVTWGWLPGDYEAWSRDSGHRLFVNLMTKKPDGTKAMWGAIASGSYDSYLNKLASSLKSFGARVYMTFQHEPEVWGGAFGTPTDYKAAFQHVVSRFKAMGVSNVKWVLVLMARTFAWGNQGTWYPGDSYVDAVGADGYNWFGCNGGSRTWRPFSQTFGPAYTWIAGKHKPMFVSEWGTVEDPSDATRKASYITDAGAWTKSHPDIKGIMYTHFYDLIPERQRDCDWTVDTSAVSLQGFRTLAADPYFNP